MKLKKLPIGIDDFKKIIEERYYFVDNSEFINELINKGEQVMLVTRPRRFGKTLTLSMLKYFYDHREPNNDLFDGLEVGKANLESEKNKYPVIFFSLKELKDAKWENTYEKIRNTMQTVYNENEEVVKKLNKSEKEYYEKIMNGNASQVDLELSLKKITEYLERYYGKKVILLIDEYDTPIISGFSNNYFTEVIDFMRNYLSAALKTNTSLKFAVMTGITKVSKENLFSGLNNLEVSSVINGTYGEFFGFTEDKVIKMLEYYDMIDKINEVRTWYNGYKFGTAQVYNPWSIINYAKHRELKTYWVNTSSDSLIKDMLRKNIEYVKDGLNKLIRREPLETYINENINYDILKTSKENIWNLFLQSGYLTVKEKVVDIYVNEWENDLQEKYLLEIPNNEVRSLYISIIKYWLMDSIGSDMVAKLLEELTTGDIENFKEMFKDIVEKYFSYYDTDKQKGEEFYHAFSLGLFVNLMIKYKVESNRESGYGRSDILLIPNDKTKRGIIIEIKRQKFEEKDLEETANDALKQIEQKKYRLELEKEGIAEIAEIGIGFRGKECEMKYRK